MKRQNIQFVTLKPQHRSGGITEYFHKYENDLNHMLWPPQLPELKTIQYLWDILDPIDPSIPPVELRDMLNSCQRAQKLLLMLVDA